MPTQPNQLMLIRHGDYNHETGHLTPRGGAEIASLTRISEPYMPQTSSGIVLTSTAPRAVESAQRFAHEFHLQVQETSLLGDGSGCATRPVGIRRLVEEYSQYVSTVILVSHKDVLEGFFQYYTLMVMEGFNYSSLDIDTGEAAVMYPREPSTGMILLKKDTAYR